MADISVYEAIGRNLGDVMMKGAPTGCTATTLDSNSLIHPQSEQLKGKEVYIYEGEGEGQARTIIDFAPANNRITIDPAWITIPTDNSGFILFEHFRMEDYENSMNRAMGMAKLKHLDEKVATMQIAGTQYEYAVPSGFEYINTLRLVPSSHTDYESDIEVDRVFEFAHRYWRIEPNSQGTFLIIFDPRKISLDNFDEEVVRIVGQAKPNFAGSLISEELQEYIIAGASMIMASTRINESREWRDKFGIFRQMKDELEPYIFTYRRGKKVG